MSRVQTSIFPLSPSLNTSVYAAVALHIHFNECTGHKRLLSQKHYLYRVLELIRISLSRTAHQFGFGAQSTTWSDTKQQTKHCGKDIEIAYPIQCNSPRQRNCIGHLTALHYYWSRDHPFMQRTEKVQRLYWFHVKIFRKPRNVIYVSFLHLYLYKCYFRHIKCWLSC